MTVYRVVRASDTVIADTDGQVSTYDKTDDVWEPREPTGGGAVRTVNGVGPDGSGNIDLGLPSSTELAAMQATLDDYQAGQDATDTAMSSVVAAGPLTRASLDDDYARDRVFDAGKYGAHPSASWQTNRDALQAANDDARAAGGGTVLIPPGTYQVKGVIQDSHVTFRGQDAVLSHPDGHSGHMIEARRFTTTGSTTAGSFTLTVADATDIEVGTVVAITGARGMSDRQNTLLASAITAGQTTGITLADPASFPMSGHMTIGAEIIGYTGISSGVLTGVTRGMYGTAAAAHGTTGPVDAIGVSAHHIAQVVTVTGSTVTLDRPAAFAVTGAPVEFSIVNPGVYDLHFEGNRQTGAQVHYPVIWATVGNGRGDGISARRAQSTVFLGLGAIGNKFGTVTADDCLLAVGVGAAFWMFQSCRGNRLADMRIVGNAFIGVYIDDRTTVASPYDGPGEDNHVGRLMIDVPRDTPPNTWVENTIGVLVSGGHRNTLGEINTAGIRTGVVFEHGGQYKSWDGTPPTCEGNAVALFRGRNMYQPWVIDAPGNAVIDAVYDSYLAFGVTTGAPFIGHAVGPNGEMVAPSPDGTPSRPGITFKSEPSTGFYRMAPGMVGFSSQGSVKVRLWPNGIRMESGGFSWTTDNLYDIGQAGAQRPRYVRAGTSLVTGAGATASRPVASAVGVGGVFFDTTLNKPIWSTGSAWVDSTGTAV